MWDKLVEFFSLLLPEDFIRRLITGVEHKLNTQGAGSWGKSLFTGALILILAAIAVDLFLYWYKKENQDRFLADWQRLRELFRSAGQHIRAILHPAQVEKEEAIDHAIEITQAMSEAEEMLEQMAEDLKRAEPEFPGNADPAPVQEEIPVQETFNTVPHEAITFKEEDPMSVPETPSGISSDNSGFAAPRRRRQEGRNRE